MENITMKTFNWKVYIDKYTDLKNAGINNLKKAWKHWICFGKFEGRTCFLEPEIISEIVAVMLLWLLGIVTWLLLLGLFMLMLKHIT